MTHRAWNTAEGEGARRWQEAGRPALPALVVDGKATSIFHVAQLAEALGLPVTAERPTWTDEARALADTLDTWCAHLRGTRWELMVEPTPSRGRSLRNLTVNTFHPIELLPAALERGRFDWDPDGDEAREASLTDARALTAYAERIAAGWRDFLARAADRAGGDPLVASPRGALPFSQLLASQRWHAAYHYRQLVEFLRLRGEAVPGALSLDGVDLPDDVF